VGEAVMKREVIGQAECPLMHRWTLLSCRFGKLLVHHFLPTQRDRDAHDHPRSFVTIVVRGGYDDVQPDGTLDRVYAPAIRYRPAEHAHVTMAGPKGAWTIVLMGPQRREWGFWRDAKWWPWRAYESVHGSSFRCDESDV
jgi:hypothetical protein